ncbi:hypothetical protein ID866_6153 [Astraeus odoratus]|nr:hypothetical protein ID866_6153 [Astraeus odoratus]
MRLPTELLIEVFMYVHALEPRQKSRHLRDENSENLGAAESMAQKPETTMDPLSPSLFPYNVASVCKWWMDILCSPSFPTFWTKVVVAVGTSTAQAAREILSWSGNLVVSLSVIQDTSPNSMQADPHSDAATVRDVTRSILPHMKRLESIRYSLSRSSSLAAACETLCGKARSLRTLHMEYKEDDGDGGYYKDRTTPEFESDGSRNEKGWKLITHAVKHLLVDNYTFKAACYPKSDGFHDLLRLRSLTLSWPSSAGTSGNSQSGRISFREFILVLQEAPMLTWLTVRNEQFDGLEDTSEILVYDLPNLRFVTLDGVSKRFIDHFHFSIIATIDTLSISRMRDSSMFS